MPQYTLDQTAKALQVNPQLAQDLQAMLAQNGDSRTPAQWLMEDLNAGDTNTNFLNAVQQANQPGASIVQAAPTASGSPSGGVVPTSNPGVPVVPTITNVAPAAGPQGFSQNEAGAQTGGFTSVGQNSQTQTGQQTQSGTEIGTQAGTQSGTSTQTTQVNDPFNLTSLVGTQLGTTTADDAANRAFLADFRDTGGTSFGGQVDQAIRRSLSGPGMQGVGQAAQGRAAGFAGAEIARTNAGQRLQAAEQINRPTGLAQTVGAVSPLLGSTTSGATTGESTAVSNLQKQLETLDLQSLVGNEAQAGTATGQSISQGSGVAPAGQQVKAGGCVVCTAYVSLGQMKPGAIRRACRFKWAHWPRYGTSLTGYFLYGPWIARAVLSNVIIRNLMRPVARAILYEEVRLSAPTRLRMRWNAYILHGVFDFMSWPVGALMKLAGMDADVRDKQVKAMLVKQNLNFSL